MGVDALRQKLLIRLCSIIQSGRGDQAAMANTLKLTLTGILIAIVGLISAYGYSWSVYSVLSFSDSADQPPPHRCTVICDSSNPGEVISDFSGEKYRGCLRSDIHPALKTCGFSLMRGESSRLSLSDQYTAIGGTLLTETRLFLSIRYDSKGRLIESSDAVPR